MASMQHDSSIRSAVIAKREIHEDLLWFGNGLLTLIVDF